MILSKEYYKDQEKRVLYSHFAVRLEERYNIEISFEEWKHLCKTHPLTILEKPQPHNKRFGFITYKGVDIVVIRTRSQGAFYVTALPITDKTYQEYINRQL